MVGDLVSRVKLADVEAGTNWIVKRQPSARAACADLACKASGRGRPIGTVVISSRSRALNRRMVNSV